MSAVDSKKCKVFW